MAIDFSTRPKPPILKRFAYLDIDGVEGPKREDRIRRSAEPRVTADAERIERFDQGRAARQTESDLDDMQRLADDLNDNVRSTRRSQHPWGPAADARARRALELRRARPPDPVAPPLPPTRMPPPGVGARMITERFVHARPWDRPRAPPRPSPRQVPADPRSALTTTLAELAELRELGVSSGVVTVEVDLRRRRGAELRARLPPGITAIELSEMAARQVMLMAWEAGVPGSPLRILSSPSGGTIPELEFAFDENVSEDDLVYECHGVTILIDEESFRLVAGRRICWKDVPGSEGFSIN